MLKKKWTQKIQNRQNQADTVLTVYRASISFTEYSNT